MDMREIMKAIGRVGVLHVEGSGGELFVEVTILNVRPHHGVIDWEVTPVAGHGTRWVRSDYVALYETVSATATVVGQVS